MASKGIEPKKVATPQIFDCDSVEIAPGTKCRDRLPRGLEEEVPSSYKWLLLGGGVIIALLIGVLIGRFLV